MFAHLPITALFFLCILISASTAAARMTDKAGGALEIFEYDILREGDPVGSHQVQVQTREDQTRVISRSQIEIGLLGLVYYRFRYESEEVWDKQGLSQLSVSVDDDGEYLELDGHRKGGRFVWSRNNADPVAQEMPVYPTNHWNPSVLSQTRVLNTLTGEINRVSIKPQQVRDRELPEAKRYRYTGDLRLDAWYDDRGRWIGMRFKGRDDSTIEYRCRNCGVGRTL